jgi:cyclophilin family peptidyl-prolyl cis-trans isomerase
MFKGVNMKNLYSRGWWRLVVVLATFVSGFNGSTDCLLAQEGSLAELQQRWREIQQQFAEKSAALNNPATASDSLKAELEGLVNEGNELVTALQAKGLAQLGNSPDDPEATRLIMGILLHQASQGKDRQVLQVGDQLIGLGIRPVYFETAAKSDRLNISGREIFEELLARQREAERNDLPRVELETTKGKIVLELYEDQAPNTVANFITLVDSGRFSEILFHRVIDGFMAQAGERKMDDSPAEELSYTIACECLSPETRRHFPFSISMAHAGLNTGGGQFFLTFSRTSHLDGRHTCFGRIIEGFEVLDSLTRTHSGGDLPIPNVSPDGIRSATVIRKRDHDYQVRKFGQPDPKDQDKLDAPPVIPAIEASGSSEGKLQDLPKSESGRDEGVEKTDGHM